MNWPRIILDGLSMSLLFNAVVGLGFLLGPQAYSTMFPKEIKEAAAPYVERRDWDLKYMKKFVPDTVFKSFEGMDHGDMALFYPERMAQELRSL